jgi:hypothetical protein
MRQYRTDRPLWVLIATSAFVALGFVDFGGKGDSSLWHGVRLLATGQWASPMDGVVGLSAQALALAVPALVAGWLVQAAAVVCGV